MSSNYQKAIMHLKSDVFKHLSTLKYLSLYRPQVTIKLLEDGPKWAVAVEIPTCCLSYDTKIYPQSETAIFINGTSQELKHELLATLSSKRYILRLNEGMDLTVLEDRFQISRGNSFASYSCSAINNVAIDNEVFGNSEITDAAVDIITRNGYSESEIKKYFDHGALWFGLMVNSKIISICFIYQNYDAIWEVAGVHTLETERNKGYARAVVTSALQYILARNLVPRYEADTQNTKSIELAQSLNLKQFLRIDHFLLNPLSL